MLFFNLATIAYIYIEVSFKSGLVPGGFKENNYVGIMYRIDLRTKSCCTRSQGSSEPVP